MNSRCVWGADRLMDFDIETLYELHYQMITLGKVDPGPILTFADELNGPGIPVPNDSCGTLSKDT